MAMEANIIYRISKGDESALNAFIDHYSDQLYRIVYGVLGQNESVEEVLSDTFFEVWQQRHTLLEIESIGGWIRTVAYRKAVSRLRHDNIIDYSDHDVAEFSDYIASPLESPDQQVISSQEVEAINRAIAELPEKCRQVFVLAKIERLPYLEISEMLGITVATVNYHVKTAITILSKRLLGKPPG